MHLSKHIGGFSLFEMCCVLAITAILTLLALPSLRQMRDHTHDTLLQSQLSHLLTFAKREARARRETITVCPSKDHLNCSSDDADTWLVLTAANSPQVLSVTTLALQHGSLHSRAFPAYRKHLLFKATGLLSDDNGTFWYCHAGSNSPAWALVLSRSGRTRVVYPEPDGRIAVGNDNPVVTC